MDFAGRTVMTVGNAKSLAGKIFNVAGFCQSKVAVAADPAVESENLRLTILGFSFGHFGYCSRVRAKRRLWYFEE